MAFFHTYSGCLRAKWIKTLALGWISFQPYTFLLVCLSENQVNSGFAGKQWEDVANLLRQEGADAVV